MSRPDPPQEPARRGPVLVGPAVLRPEHLRAMRRVLDREGFSEPEATVEPLPVWVPPAFEPVEPLPVWTPPVTARPSAPVGPCPNCGEQVAIARIDLTANASWLSCRACGLRWGGSIERQATSSSAKPVGDGERGHAAAG